MKSVERESDEVGAVSLKWLRDHWKRKGWSDYDIRVLEDVSMLYVRELTTSAGTERYVESMLRIGKPSVSPLEYAVVEYAVGVQCAAFAMTRGLLERVGDGGCEGNVRFEKPPFMTEDQAVEWVEKEKKAGRRVGLAHGHFREVTSSSALNLVLASERCDALLVGLECGSRTREHKGVKTFQSDKYRQIIFQYLLLANGYTWIEDVPYSNEGYGDWVFRLAPDIYFGQAGDPEELRADKRLRIERADGEYVELPKLPGLSTTKLLEIYEDRYRGYLKG